MAKGGFLLAKANRLAEALLQKYLRLCDTFCVHFGHCFGPQFHYMWASVPIVLFAYGYVSGIALHFYKDLLAVLLFVALPFVVVVHWILHGAFHRYGIRSVFPVVNRINDMYKNGTLIQGRPISEYDQLLKDLTKLPILCMTTSLLDVAIFLIPAAIYEFSVRGLQNLFAYLEAIAVTIPNLMFFSYVTTDLHMSKSRSEVRKKIYQLGGSPGHYYAFSLRRKFVIILLLIALSGYLLISLMSRQIQNTGFFLSNVILYAVVAMVNLSFLMGMFIFNIFQAIYTLEKMSQSLRAGKLPEVFSGTADKELARLSDGLFSAAQKILRNQQELESMVEKRTFELKEVNEKLRKQQEILNLELDLAREIQQQMFLDIPKKIHGYELYFYNHPVAKVSGDICSVFCKKDEVYLFLGDVSGHGVPAALVSIIARQAFHEALKEELTLSQVAARMNEFLLKEIKTSDYLTAFFLCLKPQGEVEYCNAGHTRALFLQKNKQISFLDTSGILLGSIEVDSENYGLGKIFLEGGDILFLYTDGITECENLEKKSFGEDRLRDFLLKNSHLEGENFSKLLLEKLAQFKGDHNFTDDISFLLAKRMA